MQPLQMEELMAVNAKQTPRQRGFFAAIGRAVVADIEFQRLNNMSDGSLAAMDRSQNRGKPASWEPISPAPKSFYGCFLGSSLPE